METNIKNLRVRVDQLAQDIIDSMNESKQLDKCVDSLFLGKAWLGKALGELSIPSPYPKDGSRKTVKDIEPTADTSELSEFDVRFNKLNHIEKVDWLREQISFIAAEASSSLTSSVLISKGVKHNVLTHLSEARFWLGFELERIKKSEQVSENNG